MTYRKLTRSKTNRKIAGVCGGLGDYLNIDPTVIRVLFILSILFIGWGLLLYCILIFVIPEE